MHTYEFYIMYMKNSKTLGCVYLMLYILQSLLFASGISVCLVLQRFALFLSHHSSLSFIFSISAVLEFHFTFVVSIIYSISIYLSFEKITNLFT